MLGRDASGAENSFPVIILSGLSGAGKSTALKVFEDLGFVTVDGLPPNLIPELVDLFQRQREVYHRGLTLGLDVRHSDFREKWTGALATMRNSGVEPRVVFVEASEEVLRRRYAATRRPHPLEQGIGLDRALVEERALLFPVRDVAEIVVDTSDYSIHDLRRTLQEKWNFLQDKRYGLHVYLVTFGFKHGVPTDADLVFDLRFLPNPYFEKALRPFTGRDKAVADFVLGSPAGREYLEKQLEFLHYVLPCYAREGRYRLTVAIGCTGGRHRSVAVAEAVFDSLRESDYAVFLEHRHLDLD
ncbi:UPF0042 nucleotide-binding protein [Desulfobaculum xiamenense]|uniref:UPF0042 nucleotide-binding protein n=1 Tax=Desulfobaculum xiamenense TaxID=995050 RepID=A0A846QDB4_9BACT|nr:RNase adapter RapZ [Desulfobaculum xiamenense]NJB66716.1 UPF0042 nucleotide-binding protein [Desulfobaculum xiamenense]